MPGCLQRMLTVRLQNAASDCQCYIAKLLIDAKRVTAACRVQPMMLQLMPVPDEPELEDVFITDSANGIQLSHVKKALADAGA